MHPHARRDGFVARPLGADLVLLGTDHDVHQLDAIAGWLWQHADGSKSPAALLTGLRAEVHADADLELVFEALDRLADAGLLHARVAPPSGITRRVTLQRLAGASALAALTAVVTRSGDALAATGGMCGDEKAIIDEIAWLEANELAVAEILEDWVEEADAKDETDDFYLLALSTREKSRKRSAAELGEDLETATDDLASCTLAEKQGVGQSEKLRKESAKKQLLKTHLRQEKDTKRSKQQLEQRLAGSASREERYKKHRIAQEELQKKQVAAKKKQVEGDGASEEAMKDSVKASRTREQAVKKRHIERTKAHLGIREAQTKQREAVSEQQIKSSQTTYLHQERLEKRKAQWKKERAQEESMKATVSSDYVLETAQQDAMAAELEAVELRKAEQAKKTEESAQEMKEKDAAKLQEQKAKQAEYAKEEQQKYELKLQEQKAKQAESATEQQEKYTAKKAEETAKANEMALEKSKKSL